MATWIATKRCEETVFNLKLPMKKRYESVKEALESPEELLMDGNVKKALEL